MLPSSFTTDSILQSENKLDALHRAHGSLRHVGEDVKLLL